MTLLVIFSSGRGLENIIVEKYYIADANDAAKSKGQLPAGSVTYRIFIDMLPAYRFQAAYGVPGHELRIETTTSFYNNEEAGAATANDIPANKLQENTLMLDSWFSVGAAAKNMYALLKSDDTSQAITNANGMLQSKNSLAGIPLRERDGMYFSSPMAVVTFFGIDSSMISMFDKQNIKPNGQVFSTDNGSWASFGGAIGPTPDNKVLIAQITTDGIFSFKLNIQIGTPDGGVENYVAENPVGNEIQLSSLIYPQVTRTISKKQ